MTTMHNYKMHPCGYMFKTATFQHMKNTFTLILMVALVMRAYGHVELNYPQGGDTLQGGQQILVQWVETIPHDTQNWDILFSPDGGQTWNTIAVDIAPGIFSYTWTVPDIATTTGRIEIIQDNNGMDYVDFSEDFTILTNTVLKNKLFIPDTLSGSSFNLSLQSGQVEFYEGIFTHTIGYNQNLLGPTLILHNGDEVTLNVTNNLNEITTVHWHGLHVAPENDGGPHTPIDPGEVWSPSFTVLDRAATYWYHPHLHEHTEEQVTKGAAGLIIVKDDEEDQLQLPRTYGIDDFPIVIQSRAFDGEKQFIIGTALDDVILCNGTVDAYLDVPAQVVRFRLLNGSTERVYYLGFESDIGFYQIASDGGLLDAPVYLTRLNLAPGERAELLMDLSNRQGETINLMSFASELENGIYGAENPSGMPMGGITGYSSNPLNGNDFTILQLSITESTAVPVTSIPVALVTNVPYAESDADETRNLLFQSTQPGPTGALIGPFVINGAGFDMDVVNFEVPLHHTEIWQLTNMTAIAHPFHIHDVQFYILEIDGIPPPPNMRGRKDVVLVPPVGGSVRVIARFEDFANADVPYMFHCHMLSHEDDGFMGQFIVVDNPSSVWDDQEDTFTIYPNPTTQSLTIRGLHSAVVEIFNASGEYMESLKITDEGAHVSLAGYASGIYYFRVTNSDISWVYKVIKI